MNTPTGSHTHAIFYDPKESLHPGFQNYAQVSFPPPLPPHLLPSATTPVSHILSQPPPTVFQMLFPSVPSAALSDLFTLFDGLDYTNPPARHLRRMPLHHCSLTGTASSWYNPSPQVEI